VIACAVAIVFSGAGSALADVEMYPADWNGQKVYLSQACHGANGGSNCNENTGCNGYGENFWSASWADKAAFGGSNVSGTPLISRGYAVRIGQGGASNNINSSNAWGATMHIPMHSNARDPVACPTTDNSYGGTWMLYLSSNGRQLSDQLLYTLRGVSPGTNDRLVYRSDLGELTQTRAVAAYMETEFHTWQRGVDFLADPWQHSWRVGYGVDRCRGYPRDYNYDQPTSTKYCSW